MMQFTVVTDHASLKCLMSLRDLNGRWARWSLQLQTYDFEIQHCKSADNIVADTLSRFVDSVEMEEDEEHKFQIEEDFKSAEYLNRIQVVAENQEELSDLKIVEGKIFKRFFDKNQPELGEFAWKLWVKRIVIPAKKRNQVING